VTSTTAAPRVRSHRDLVVWQKAMDLVVAVYRLAERFPRSETYRLTSQITRAAVAVPANIAAGHARSTARDYANFLAIAKGSLMETETYVMLAMRLDYVDATYANPILAAITEQSKMLTTLRNRLLE
jgi:four helix bundle protein